MLKFTTVKKKTQPQSKPELGDLFLTTGNDLCMITYIDEDYAFRYVHLSGSHLGEHYSMRNTIWESCTHVKQVDPIQLQEV